MLQSSPYHHTPLLVVGAAPSEIQVPSPKLHPPVQIAEWLGLVHIQHPWQVIPRDSDVACPLSFGCCVAGEVTFTGHVCWFPWRARLATPNCTTLIIIVWLYPGCVSTCFVHALLFIFFNNNLSYMKSSWCNHYDQVYSCIVFEEYKKS